MTRELLARALDALGTSTWDHTRAVGKQELIDALRKALAAPMPEPSDMVMVPREPTQGHFCRAVRVAKFLPTLDQERYKDWAAEYRAMIAAAPPAAPAVPLSCNKVPPGNGYCDYCARGEYEKCRYTTPAAPPAAPAVPLTDEQMWELWNSQGDDAMDKTAAIKFARAIEKAHGIGGGNG